MFGELFHVNDADGNLALLPEGMDLGAATMVSDMVPTGFHGAELADIQFGDDVAVIGIGPGWVDGRSRLVRPIHATSALRFRLCR